MNVASCSRHRRTASLALLGLVLAAASAQAQPTWPQEIPAPEGNIVVYQPQPEKLEGNVLHSRAAVALELKGGGEPVFGAAWFSAVLDTDLDARTAIVRDVRVAKVVWPGSTDAQEQRFTAVVEDAAAGAAFEISLEELSESLADAELEQRSLEGLRNDPPEIVFREELSVLLLYDGDPRFSAVENSEYERALNTPLAVARRLGSERCYLTSGPLWYEAPHPLGPWTVLAAPPADLVQMVPESGDGDIAPGTPPAIVVATVPTELICTQGAPDWQTLAGGKLLYVGNTETAWLRELSTNNMYVLISGRWFRSKSTDGPWTFVRPDELPESFREIPPESDIGGVRTSVAGTDEAEDAVLDAHIPQTAIIDRAAATLVVEYDGAPSFEPVTGTRVSYAVNTATQVLQVKGRYYAVDDGVWFTSASAEGPWEVADSIPEGEIQDIPPSSPVYNTTYVHVYDSTPTHVTVGYLPGYMWSYPYYGVPVYGTGWYYPPYWGHYYYPRPVTYGMHVGYNPWTGWSFGVSWSNGFMSVGVRWGGGYGYRRPGYGCGGFYGGGYRGPVVINTGNVNIGNSINVGNRGDAATRIGQARPGATTRPAQGARPGSVERPGGGAATRPQARPATPSTRPGTATPADRVGGRQNLYDRPETRDRTAPSPATRDNVRKADPAPSRQNNVYSDRDGNVGRSSPNGWERRDQGGWTPDRAPDRTRDYNRAQQSRQSGAQRRSQAPARQPSPSRQDGSRGGRRG